MPEPDDAELDRLIRLLYFETLVLTAKEQLNPYTYHEPYHISFRIRGIQLAAARLKKIEKQDNTPCERFLDDCLRVIKSV